MNKIFGYYIFGGMLIGAFFGLGGSANSNPLMGLWIGALTGAFIGWFVAAAVLERRNKEK